MENILITGINGFIGSHVAKYYKEKGLSVIGIGKDCKCIYDNIRYFQMDLTIDDISSIVREYSVDLIIHCAGNASVPMSLQNPLRDYELNTTVLYRLMESCRKFENLKIINFSSASVYGNPKRLPIKEEDEKKPISIYALNKMLGEEICNYYREFYSMNVINIRIFSAYGPGLKKQIFWDMYQKIKKEKKLDLFGTGFESRDFIYIDDLVEAINLIATKANVSTINVANGEEVFIHDIAELFAEKAGIDKKTINFNQVTRAGDPLNWKADISILKSLGYKKKICIRQGIENYYRWVTSFEYE